MPSRLRRPQSARHLLTIRSAGRRRLPSRRDSICSSRTRITKGTQNETTGRVPPFFAVQRRAHRRPPLQPGPNEAKPASPVHHATGPNSPHKQDSSVEPIVGSDPQETRTLLPVKTNPKTNPPAASRHPPCRAAGASVPGPTAAAKRSQTGQPCPSPPNRASRKCKKRKTNPKSPMFSTPAPRKRTHSPAPRSPAQSGARPSGGAGPPCGSTRAPARAVRHPRVCHGPATLGYATRWHPPPQLC
jgi:hypothetical protein